MSVDEFQGNLAGLLLVEAEFESADELAAFPTPSFANRDVTSDVRYTGGALVKDGLPSQHQP